MSEVLEAPATVEYTPSLTLAKFHASNALVRGVRGPIGSGKSVGCCWEIWSRANEQWPGPDGVRRSRWVATRNTYGELTTTTLRTWLDWFPEDRFGKVVYGAPITHVLKWTHEDGSEVELEMWFLALDRPEHVKKLLSLEISGAWMNEAREQPKAILDGLTGRVGRYPKAQDGGCKWSGVILDTNPPDDDHWWYQIAEITKPADHDFFSQPPGDSDEAENLDWLMQTPETMLLPVGHPKRRAHGATYYKRLKAGKTDEWIKVYVKGQYGTVHDGKPVYTEWNDNLHAKELTPIQGRRLVIGLDFGLTPAAVLTQVDARGRLVVIDEYCGEDMAVRQFLEDVLIPALMSVYPAWWAKKDEMILFIGDPAGEQRTQTDERSCFEEVRAKKLKIRAAKSNAWLPRRGAVVWFLSKLSDGKPMFLLDPQACPVLRKGFNGGYKYRRIQVVGDERFSDEPAKNKYSHCFTAETLVATPDGERPIASLKVGDAVWTPAGARKVTACMSRWVDTTMEMEFSNGRSVVCTPDHPFMVGDTRVRADELQYTDVLQSIGETAWADASFISRRFSRVSASIARLGATTSRTLASTCTALFGRPSRAQFLPDTMCIIGMRTRATIELATLNACLAQSTPLAIAANDCLPAQRSQSGIWPRFARQLLSGTDRPKVWHGMRPTQRPHGSGVQASGCSASIAPSHSSHSSARPSVGFVRRLANRLLGVSAGLMTRLGLVRSARPLLSSTNTPRPAPALRLVRASSLVAPKEVFDLTVDDQHCFYASGVLVSNCHDALQYAALEAGGIQAVLAEQRPQVRRIPADHGTVPGFGSLG